MSLFLLLLLFLLSALAGAERCLGGCRRQHGPLGGGDTASAVAVQRVRPLSRPEDDELTAPCRTGVLTNAPFAGLPGLYRNLPTQVTRGEGREGKEGGGRGGEGEGR